LLGQLRIGLIFKPYTKIQNKNKNKLCLWELESIQSLGNEKGLGFQWGAGQFDNPYPSKWINIRGVFYRYQL